MELWNESSDKARHFVIPFSLFFFPSLIARINDNEARSDRYLGLGVEGGWNLPFFYRVDIDSTRGRANGNEG